MSFAGQTIKPVPCEARVAVLRVATAEEEVKVDHHHRRVEKLEGEPRSLLLEVATTNLLVASSTPQVVATRETSARIVTRNNHRVIVLLPRRKARGRIKMRRTRKGKEEEKLDHATLQDLTPIAFFTSARRIQ